MEIEKKQIFAFMRLNSSFLLHASQFPINIENALKVFSDSLGKGLNGSRPFATAFEREKIIRSCCLRIGD